MLCLLSIRINIRARHDPHPVHSVFDTHLFVFVTEAIRIRIYIRDYPCSNSNSIKNVKANTISIIHIRIRSIYIRHWRSGGVWLLDQLRLARTAARNRSRSEVSKNLAGVDPEETSPETNRRGCATAHGLDALATWRTIRSGAQLQWSGGPIPWLWFFHGQG